MGKEQFCQPEKDGDRYVDIYNYGTTALENTLMFVSIVVILTLTHHTIKQSTTVELNTYMYV